MKSPTDMRASERGAVRIQTVLTFVAIGIIAFALIKVVPVYIEQRGIQTKVDELARISAARNYKQDRINTEIQSILADDSLPAGSVTIVTLAENKVHLKLEYRRTIDFIVTQWDWAVSYTAEGKAL